MWLLLIKTLKLQLNDSRLTEIGEKDQSRGNLTTAENYVRKAGTLLNLHH